MDAWRRKKGLMRPPRYSTIFEPMEREVLASLAADVAQALIGRCQSAPKDELAELTGMPSGHKYAPEQPELARLLPSFERDGDQEFEGENELLRSLHENDIAKAKLERLFVISMHLGPDGDEVVVLTEEEAHSWVGALTDLRLYLSAVRVEGGPKAEEDREALIEWLAYNQESLLQALMGDLG